MRGTALQINNALYQPIIILGVEKRLMLLNALLSFPLIAASHFLLPASLIGIAVFSLLHLAFIQVTKYDPLAATLFKRATRYVFQPYFPAQTDHNFNSQRRIKTISRPY